jgi:hypothetical protein
MCARCMPQPVALCHASVVSGGRRGNAQYSREQLRRLLTLLFRRLCTDENSFAGTQMQPGDMSNSKWFFCTVPLPPPSVSGALWVAGRGWRMLARSTKTRRAVLAGVAESNVRASHDCYCFAVAAELRVAKTNAHALAVANTVAPHLHAMFV